MERDTKAAFVGKKELVPGISTFSFRPEEKIAFEAGQFAFLTFEAGGKRHTKHFTISSTPQAGEIEFTTIVSESDYKKSLSGLKPGAEAWIGRPMGNFTLKARKSDRIAFLAGGIGITPVKSILRSLSETGRPEGLDITLFYSNRNEERIVFRQVLEELAQKHSFLKIVHTLTDLSEEEKRNWKGETGYINAEMVKRHLGETGGTTFFVVGPPAFNQAMRKMLLEKLKVKEEMVLAETFTGY